MAALELGPTSRLVTIASGGCNVMSYLTADPMRVQAVDLNPGPRRPARAQARRCPPSAALRGVPRASSPRPTPATTSASTSGSSRRDWSPRSATTGMGATSPGAGGSACSGRNLYGHGLLGRTIQLGHLVCRLHGKRPQRMLDARDLAEQRQSVRGRAGAGVREPARAPAGRPARRPISAWAFRRRSSTRSRPTPAADLATLVRARVERLACDFPIQENWFAWQAFGRRYPGQGRGLPPYLRPENFAALRARVDRVDIEQITSPISCAARTPAASTPTSCSTPRTG